MAQISLYVNEMMAKKLQIAAASQGCSISKYVADIIYQHFSEDDSEEIRKKQLLHKLCGAIDDPTFVEPPEIPWSADTPRRFELL